MSDWNSIKNTGCNIPAHAKQLALLPRCEEELEECLAEIKEYSTIAKPPVSNRLKGRITKIKSLLAELQEGK